MTHHTTENCCTRIHITEQMQGQFLNGSHVNDTEKNPLQWPHNEPDCISNHQPHDCLLNRLFRRRSKKTSKLRVTGLCAGNSPGTGEFPAQKASNAENVSIWWRHHALMISQHWFGWWFGSTGNKPLSDAVLNQAYVAIWRHLDMLYYKTVSG